MGTTAELQSKELKDLNTGEIVGNKKLDGQELKFLTSQEKLLLNFVDETENKLLTDIRETNRTSFGKSEKVRQLLNGLTNNSGAFVDQIVRVMNIPANSILINTFKDLMTRVMRDPKILDFNKQVFCVKILFDMQSGKKTLNQLKSYVALMKGGLKDVDIRDKDFTRSLFNFQKQSSSLVKTKGRSDADCIIGPKTVQQLFAATGIVSTMEEVSVDQKFSKTVLSEKDAALYTNSKDIIAQVDAYYKDVTTKEPKDKVKNMIEFVKKIQACATYDNTKIVDVKANWTLDYKLKYTATTRLMQQVQIVLANDLNVNADDYQTKKQEILDMLNSSGLDIKKYWNSKTTREDIGITKTDDYMKDLDNKVEEKKQFKEKINIVLSVASVYIKYFANETSEDDSNLIGMRAAYDKLLAMQNNPRGVSDIKIKEALAKVFVSTFLEEKSMVHEMWDNIWQSKFSGSPDVGVFLVKKYGKMGSQYSVFGEIMNKIFDKKVDYTNPINVSNVRADVLLLLRKIDKDYDGFTVFDTYNSGDAILSEIEGQRGNQKLNALRVEGLGKGGEALNADLAKINTVFTKLENNDPDAVAKCTKLMSLIGKTKVNPGEMIKAGDDMVLTKESISIAPEAMKLFQEIFPGITLSMDVWEKIYDTLQTINSKTALVIKESEFNLKKSFIDAKDSLVGKIGRYQDEIDYLKSKDPTSTKITEYEQNILMLQDKQKNIQTAIEGGKVTGADPMYEGKTMKEIATIVGENMQRAMFAQAIETAVTYSVLENHGETFNQLHKKPPTTGPEKILDLYANIKGIGGYLSDGTYNTIVDTSKEIIIQVAIAVVSFGIASVVSELVIQGSRVVLTAVKAANVATKIGRYAKIAEGGFLALRTVAAAERVGVASMALTKLVIEGTVFHLSSTVLNNAFQGVDLGNGLGELKGYIQSIAFLGVLKEVSTFVAGLKIAKGAKIEELLAKKIDISKTKLFAIKAGDAAKSLGAEVGSLMITDQIVNIAFGDGFKEITVKDMVHIVGMVIGMRALKRIDPTSSIVREIRRRADGTIEAINVNGVWSNKGGKKNTGSKENNGGSKNKNKSPENKKSGTENVVEEIVNKTDAKYDKALDLMGNKEIVIEIGGRTVRLQKRGDRYELMYNQAGIRNARNDRFFTKAEVRELLKSSENNIRTEITESDIIAKYEKVITEHQNKEIVIEIGGRTVRLQKRGDRYELMYNQAGIKNERNNSYFTKAEVIELARKNSSNLSIEGVRIEEIELVMKESEVLSSTPEAIVAKSEVKGLLARVKEFFKRPEESKIKEVEKEIENKEAEIISNKTSPEVKKTVRDFLQKIKDLFANWKQRWTREKTNKPQVSVIENNIIEPVVEVPKTMDELIDIVEQQGPVEAYKQGKVESDGSVSPSGDKKVIKPEEIVKDINEGNFEDLNFQKGDKMLKLRQEGVDLYIKEKINSVEDLLDFVQKNPKLFGGADKQASLIRELTKEGKTDVQRLEQFNKKVQDKYSGISGPNSKTGFDMKSMIEGKVNELKSQSNENTNTNKVIENKIVTEISAPDKNIELSQQKILEKPLKENFTDQEWLEFKDALLSNMETKYPKWYKEILDLGYSFEPLKNSSLWGKCDAENKIIYINPCKTSSAPGLAAKGADIPITSAIHEMSHIITERNLDLSHLAAARIKDGNYVNFLEKANNEQLLFIELADVYERKGQTFCPHAMSTEYTLAKGNGPSGEVVDLGKILPVREDMVELNAKYLRGELETYLNKRGSAMGVSKETINSILKSFESAFGSKITKPGQKKEIEMKPNNKEPEYDIAA